MAFGLMTYNDSVKSEDLLDAIRYISPDLSAVSKEVKDELEKRKRKEDAVALERCLKGLA